MARDEDTLKVPKLATNGSNWITYKDRLRWALAARGTLKHIEPDGVVAKTETASKADTAPLTETSAATVKPGDTTRSTKSVDPEKWELEESQVKQCIAATVSDSIFNRIKNGKTAQDVWNSLTKIYSVRSCMVAVDLRTKMSETRCGEKDDMRTHFDTMADMYENLASMGTTITDTEYTMLLLRSLPRSYAPLVTAMNTAATLRNETVSPEMLIQLVTDEYESRTNRSGGTNTKSTAHSDDAAFAASAGNFRSGGGGGRKRVECYNCHKKGHVKAECWAKGGGKEGQRPAMKGKATDSANAAAAQDDEGVWTAIVDDEDLSIDAVGPWTGADDAQLLGDAVEVEDHDTLEVISVVSDAVMAIGEGLTKGGVESDLYDSGASRHMSPFRHRFLTFEDIEPRPIAAADKRVFQATGKGEIRIEVPNGNTTSSVLLKDVLYAPTMGLNVDIANGGRRIRRSFPHERLSDLEPYEDASRSDLRHDKRPLPC